MFQNLKVDIIYYKTNTDFELEFNLCGCCKMRLLHDNASDYKNLVHHLARAITRSRVIIVVGGLFGDDGIISSVASSIGKSLTEISNRRYGISGGESISIINGSTPLVTPDGYFGGCIIESGPQSMILLSENKTVRKSIMTSLIHPYIEELCAIELQENASSAVPAPVPATDRTETSVSEVPVNEEPSPTDEIGEASVDNSDAENNSAEDFTPEEDAKALSDFATSADPDVSVSPGMSFDTGDKPLYTETGDAAPKEMSASIQNIKSNDKESGSNNVKSDLSVSDGKDSVTDIRPSRKKPAGSSGVNLTVLILSIILLIVIAVLCYCIFYIPSKEGISASAYLKQLFDALLG